MLYFQRAWVKEFWTNVLGQMNVTIVWCVAVGNVGVLLELTLCFQTDVNQVSGQVNLIKVSEALLRMFILFIM